MNPALAIEARGLTKRYGDLVAVDAVDLEIRPGELFGLLGPNGAGKTTVVRMLTGLVSITAGEAWIGGVSVNREPDRVRRMLGVVPQALTSDLDLSGYENLDLFARFFDVGRARRRTRIEELLRRVGLWERRRDLVKTYSGGMRRRLEIARGLVHTPKVLFLDEPTIGLDPQSRHVIWELLTDLRKEAELTISLTTHYMEEAETLCDRVAIIDRGKRVALGSPEELKQQIPGSDTIELDLREPLSEADRAGLRGLARVREVTPTPHGVRVRADGGAELLPELFERLRQAGHPIASAHMSEISLEDVFMLLTGRSLRAESGAARRGPPRMYT